MTVFYCSICGLDTLRAGSVYSHRCREAKIARIEAEYAKLYDADSDDEYEPPDDDTEGLP